MQVTTKSSNKIWEGGGRTLWEVVLEYGSDQKVFKCKTYSSAIAGTGFSGEVEIYEKEGKYGSEQFARQVRKEGDNYGSRGGGSNYQPKDEKAIKAMWAIGQAVQLIPDKTKIELADIEANAQQLFEMVDRVKIVDEINTEPVKDVFGEAEPLDVIDLEDL